MTATLTFVDTMVSLVRRLSLWIARGIGVLLLVVVTGVIIEIVARKLLGRSFSGIQEYSGYMLAILSSCGLAHTLMERAHIRIDLGYSRLPTIARTGLDLCAILLVNVVAWMITYRAWKVLGDSFENGTAANTPLSTPLWIPQLIWVLGWTWFAFTAAVLAIRGLLAAMQRDRGTVQKLIGTGEDLEVLEAKQLARGN